MKTLVYVNNDLCPCGYGVLKDDIKFGTEYVIDENTIQSMRFRCGGCHRWIPNVRSAFAYRDGIPKGFIPLMLFRERVMA